MSIKDAILATLHAQEDGVRGRTLLQKKLYFLAVLSGEDFEFSPHYYGPYSSRVAEELGALVEADFVNEKVENFAEMVGPFGELRRYDYTLSQAGEKVFASRRDITMKRYEEPLQLINGHPIANDPNLLSVAAKVHFIVAGRNRASVQDIQRHAGTLGWEISKEDIRQVVEYLRHLNLISSE